MTEPATDYLATIALESKRFGEALSRGPLDATIAGCPEWTLQDLAMHLGGVQRWATGIIATGSPGEDGDGPGDGELLSWFAEGTAGLLAAFEAASPDAQCWTLEPGNEGTVSFWHRRQALETAIHRWDADNASGLASPIEPALAADVVDEWVNVFVRRKLAQGKADLTPLDGDVHIHCTDVPGEWTFEIIDGEVVVVDEHRKSSVAIKGAAGDLALFVYRRGDDSGVEIFGDEELLDRWFTALG